MEKIIRLDTVEEYSRVFGLPTLHPLLNVVDLSEAALRPEKMAFNYGIYALFLKDTKCGDIRYGKQTYDYQEGTVVSFAPGQVVEVDLPAGLQPKGRGILFHPDLVRGTSLGREIKSYSFFSYSSREALHLSEEEKQMFLGLLSHIRTELSRPTDRLSKRLLVRSVQLLLDYCMRFYSRQFETRTKANRDVLTRFEALLDSYFLDGQSRHAGLPTVKYFADRVYLSPNYFGDLIKKETGKTAQEYIQGKLIDLAKEMIVGTDKTVSQIAYELGFQYSQHFNRTFKKNVGYTPSESRRMQSAS